MIVTQTIELTNRVTQLQILGRRIAAAVLLIQALGGGRSIADLPSAHTVTTDRVNPRGIRGGGW